MPTYTLDHTWVHRIQELGEIHLVVDGTKSVTLKSMDLTWKAPCCVTSCGYRGSP